MFAISERNKRSLCRGLFLLVCCLPTTVIVSVAMVSRTSPYRNYARASWERTLSDRLGLAVSLYDVTNIRPDVWVLRGVQIRDAELDEAVATVSQVRITRQNQNLDCVLTHPEVQGEHLPRLMHLLHERAFKSGLGSKMQVAGYARQLEIQWSGQTQRLDNVQWDARVAAEQGSRVELKFGVEEDASPRQLEAVVTRSLEQQQPTTTVVIDTHGARLPNPLLGICLPQLANLGADSQFAGRAVVRLTTDDYSGNLAGELLQVDLEALVRHRHPEQLTGTADIQLQAFHFHKAGIEQLQGRLTANDVLVGKPLLLDAIAAFGLSCDQERCRFVERQPFRQLQFEFQLDDQGIGFCGACDRFPRGVVLRAFDSLQERDVAIAWHAPAGSVVPAAALVRMLHHSATTQEGAALLARLPLPSTETLPGMPWEQNEAQTPTSTAQWHLPATP
tara:strand:+ start:222 stop:1562 length:1341 start_codon:yes stop_codon:yes gene_type:complete